MKAIASIRNKITQVPAMTWMWIGSIAIVISIALQAAGLLLPPLTFALTMSGLALNAASVVFTIRQAYRSALEFEQARRKLDAAAQDYASRGSEIRGGRNLHKAPDSIPDRQSQVIQRRNDALE